MDILTSVLKMGGALLVVLGGIALTAHFAKRFVYPRLGLKQAPIQILATSYLGQKRQVSILDVGGVYLVVGITPTQISLLTRLEKWPLDIVDAGGPA